MAITLTCPACATLLRVPDTAAGKKIRCTKCEHVFVASVEAVPTPPPAVTPTVSPTAPISMELDDVPVAMPTVVPLATPARAVPPPMPPLVLEEAPEEFQPQAEGREEKPRAPKSTVKPTNWPLILGGGGTLLFLLISGGVVGGLMWVAALDRPQPQPRPMMPFAPPPPPPPAPPPG